jgi:predicted DNA-binding protein YlxM (UPF0122 family)
LITLYQVDQLSVDAIASKFDLGPLKVIGLLEEFSIPLRRDYEGYYVKRRGVKFNKPPKFKKPTDQQLRRWYLEERKSSIYIAKLVGVGKYAVLVWLKKAGIGRRKDQHESHGYTFKKPSKERLKKWYWEELKSTYEIAKIVGVDTASIRNWMIEYGIPARSRAQSKFALKGRLVEEPSKEELNMLYIIEKKSTMEIAEVYGVSDTVMGRWLKKHGIERRDPREALSVALGRKPIEKPSKEELERWYLEEKKSTHTIAEECGVKQISVWRWLNEYGILKRGLMESQFAYHGKEVEKPSEEELSRFYVQEEKSLSELGELFEVDPSTVADWLEGIGVERREVIYGYKEFLTCHDGDLVKSTYERRVDNWLYKMGIPHDYGKKLPGKTMCRCDFKVGDVYIEIWGLIGTEFYEEKMEEKKIPYYEKHGLNRIDLSPEDFDLKNSFTKKLEPLLKYSDPTLRRQRQIREY